MNILAHGTLGGFDELIFIGVVVIFVVMMALSWLRSLDEESPLLEDSEKMQGDENTNADSEHFHLD